MKLLNIFIMKKLSEEKMQELVNDILAIDKAEIKKMRENPVRRLEKILTFRSPDAISDLVSFARKENWIFSSTELEIIVRALLDKKLSEGDFIRITGHYRIDFGERLNDEIINSVANGSLSLDFFYKELSLSCLVNHASFKPIILAVARKKLPLTVLLILLMNGVLLRKDLYLIVNKYLACKFSLSDMDLLIKKGLVFFSSGEIKIITAVIDGKKTQEILLPFFRNSYQFKEKACELIKNALIEGKLSLYPLLQQAALYSDWCNYLVVPISEAVNAGKFEESILQNILEDVNADIREDVWEKLFSTGNHICVEHYLRKFYPELLSKL